MSFEGRRLQIPACHSRESGNPSLPFHQGTVVHRYPDRRMAVFHGPRKLAEYESDGALVADDVRTAPACAAVAR